MVKLGFSILLLGLTLAAAPVQAANRDAKERAAKRACLNGDAAKGVQILTELYIGSEDPVYLYNQGRCYEQNNRYEEAIGRFREFLRKSPGSSNSDTADTDSAKKHIADCEAVLGRKAGPAENTATAAVPTPPPPPPLPPPPPEPKVVPQVLDVRRPADTSNSSDGGGLRIAGIATAAVGAAGIVAGVLLNLKANSTVSDLQKHYDDGSYSSSKDYRTGSQVAYGVGAAFVAGGAVLYYLGVRANHVAVAPVAVQGGAAAVLTGAF